MIIDGQVHGGITQGIAAALYEEGVYDEDGNLQTTTMTTSRAVGRRGSVLRDRPHRDAGGQPARRQGGGETGTIAAAPAVMNAVVDALSHLGVTDVPMPATPERVWTAIEEAKR